MTETIIGCVTVLAEAFGRKLTKTTIEAYTIGLKGLSDQQIRTASEAAIQSCKFMPTPAELRELAGALRMTDRAEVAWLAFHKAVCDFGPYHSINFDDVTINAVVRGLGGWLAVCEIDGKEFESFLRARFLKAYEALARAGVGAEQAAPLLGFYDQENCRNGHGAAKPPKLITTGLKPLPNAPRIGAPSTPQPIELPKLRAP